MPRMAVYFAALFIDMPVFGIINNSMEADAYGKQQRELKERVKELNCLYRIADLCAKRNGDLVEVLRSMLPHIAGGWQFPSKAAVRIVINGQEIQSRNFREDGCCLQRAILVDGIQKGSLEVRYPETRTQASADSVFLEGEVKLVEGVAALIGNMVAKYEADGELRKRALELARQKGELEKKNIALREILTQLGIEKNEMESKIQANIENVIMPNILKLKKGSFAPDIYQKYVDTTYRNLQNITSAFGLKIGSRRYGLSPRELEISSLVRSGWSNKEIADLLCISIATVERHRHNVRRKLGITNSACNLATFLMASKEL